MYLYTMEHTERYQLALDLCARMAATYPVIIGGVYGSTARGTDMEWSDLEMWFVVADGCGAQGQHFIFQKIAVGYRVYRESELIEILTNSDGRWPFHVGALEALDVLCGDPARVREWINQATATSKELFHDHLATHLPELVVESYGRIHSSAARGDWATARYARTEVLFEMQTALCLLNKRWVTRDYDAGLLQVAAFPKIPAGYGDLVPALLAAKDFDTLLPLVDQLVEGFWQLVKVEGIAVRNFQSVEEIPI
jgi:predicted nucleotidyltransferase